MDGLYYSGFSGNPKNLNKHTILELIRFTPGGISRAELARRMELSRSAITLIINNLLELGIVREAERVSSSSGRRPVLLEINPSRGYVVGIDLGATHATFSAADFSARVVHELEFPFDVAQGPLICLEQVNGYLCKLLEGASLAREDILTISIGVPGPIAGDGGKVVAPPIMPGWDNFPIRETLQTRWDCPVSLNNDAELGALGEWAYGAGRDEKNLVFIKVGSGVGAGLLLNDRMYRGESGTAGEIGHLTIDEDGPLCECGNRGCLEAFSGGRAIARQARQAVQAGQRTLLATINPLDKITAQDVTIAARRGDLVAQRIITEAGTYLGTAIAGLINLLNPGIVVVGGGVAQAGDLFLEPVRQAARKRSLKAANQVARITASVLGRRSSITGAVVQALTVVLHQIADR